MMHTIENGWIIIGLNIVDTYFDLGENWRGRTKTNSKYTNESNNNETNHKEEKKHLTNANHEWSTIGLVSQLFNGHTLYRWLGVCKKKKHDQNIIVIIFAIVHEQEK